MARASRAHNPSLPGQKTTAACAAATAKKATTPAVGCWHQGQCGGPALWILQAAAAPLQSEWQPQAKIVSQTSMNKTAAVARAAESASHLFLPDLCPINSTPVIPSLMPSAPPARSGDAAVVEALVRVGRRFGYRYRLGGDLFE